MGERLALDRSPLRLHESGHAFVSTLFGEEFMDYRTGVLPHDVYDVLNTPSFIMRHIGSIGMDVSKFLRSFGQALSVPYGHVVSRPVKQVGEEPIKVSVDMQNLLIYLAGACFEAGKDPAALRKIRMGSDGEVSQEIVQNALRQADPGLATPDHVSGLRREFAQWYALYLQDNEFCRGRQCVEEFFSSLSTLESIRMNLINRLQAVLPFVTALASPVLVACSCAPEVLVNAANIRGEQQTGEVTAGLYAHLREGGFPQERLAEMGNQLHADATKTLTELFEKLDGPSEVEGEEKGEEHGSKMNDLTPNPSPCPSPVGRGDVGCVCIVCHHPGNGPSLPAGESWREGLSEHPLPVMHDDNESGTAS
jgi:hypothetical protein